MKKPTAIVAVSAATLAGALAAALSVTVPAAAAGDNERCYGIALKGQNDCKAGSHDCKGQSTVNFDKHSFIMAPKGECTKIKPSLNG